MGFDEEGGLGGGRRAVELAMKGGKLAREVFRRGEDEGPWATEGCLIPGGGSSAEDGGEGAREERSDVQSIKARKLTPEARRRQGRRRGAQAACYCQRRLALSAGTRKEARSAGGMEGAQRESTEWTI